MTSVIPCVPASLPGQPARPLKALQECVLLHVSLAAQAKTPKLHASPTKGSTFRIDDLPEDLYLTLLNHHFDVKDLCSLAQVSRKHRQLASSDSRWEVLYQQAFADITDVTRQAATYAGSWKELYRCKSVSDKLAEPWLTPCEHELTAVLQRITREQAQQPVAGGIIFLLDGSGSVSQDDFSAMTTFVTKAAAAASSAVPDIKVGVMQFSNDIQIEVPLNQYHAEDFKEAADNMVRMNGGTNVALAIQTASKQMRSRLPETAPRTLILLTDGRIDGYQGKEAVKAVQLLSSEQANVSIYTFGVGSGVDRFELDKIVAASGCSDLECRYMPLAVHPESSW